MQEVTNNSKSLDATTYSIETNGGLLLCGKLVYPQNSSPFILCDRAAGHSVIDG
jgi:hypothetical protein